MDLSIAPAESKKHIVLQVSYHGNEGNKNVSRKIPRKTWIFCTCKIAADVAPAPKFLRPKRYHIQVVLELPDVPQSFFQTK